MTGRSPGPNAAASPGARPATPAAGNQDTPPSRLMSAPPAVTATRSVGTLGATATSRTSRRPPLRGRLTFSKDSPVSTLRYNPRCVAT